MNNLLFKRFTIIGLLVLPAILISQIACAQPSTYPQNNNNSGTNKLGFTVLLGGNSSRLDNNGHIYFPIESFRTDSFKMNQNKIYFSSAVGIAYHKIIDTSLLQSISLGINAYYTKTTQNGSVYEYSLPDFNNSTYQMKIKSYRIMLDTEWALHPLYFGIFPFIEAGIGSVQHTMSFENTPRPNIGADGGNYYLANNLSTHIAYELGAGLKLPVTSQFILSARYLFADTGKAESRVLDTATGVTLSSPVRTKVQSQSILFGLSYLFG